MKQDDAKKTLTPSLRFPEFRKEPGWNQLNGDELFDQINNRAAAPGLPVLAITQEHGAIPRDQIDFHVSVTDASIDSYKEVCDGDFINASEHFVKGKRQNQLTQAHIDKIIDTYQYRRKADRYSRRVTMKEITANDFNLNISRYISTAQDEVEIDLAATHAELVQIENTIRKATTKHNEFLKELGLSTLPSPDPDSSRE